MKRKNIFQKVTTYGLIFAICVVMVFWASSSRSPKSSDPVALQVNGEVITLSELNQAFANYAGQRPDVNRAQHLPEVIEALIQQKVFVHKAQSLGIGVSDESVRKEIKEIPAFQKDGVFQEENYFEYLKNTRQSAGKLENRIRDGLRTKILSQLFAETVKTSEFAKAKEYLLNNSKFQYEFVQIESSKIKIPVPSQKELDEWLSKEENAKLVQEHYDRNKEFKYKNKNGKDFIKFESIRLEIAQQLHKEQLRKSSAKDVATSVLDQWQKGKHHGLLKLHQLKVEKSEEVSAQSSYLKGIGYRPELAMELFKLKVGDFYPNIVDSQKDFFIIKLSSKKAASFENYEPKGDGDDVDFSYFRNAYLKARLLENDVSGWLRKKANIFIAKDTVR
ncbi:MAG: peptidylprolyl isomerase [Deltaproteobacteria bacterium]|nr:peptidylprolyl isomerase [Deltaproteobacteria bacterium]